MEAQIKALTQDVFSEHVRPLERQLNVYGVPHLGDFSLIERCVKTDGLAMLRSNSQDNMRYLFSAWRGQNPKRGLHFLRTYLQLLWPNGWSVTQLWQDKSKPYPSALVAPTDAAALAAIRQTHFLTSRLNVDVSTDAETGTGLASVARSLRSILPAKFVVVLRKLRTGQTITGVASVGSACKAAFTEGLCDLLQSNPALSLDFVNTSQPTLALDFAANKYTGYVQDDMNTTDGLYQIWSNEL